MENFEKLGLFYLGKTAEPNERLVLYESKNLTTHAVCVGMTGSGKTGLGVALLEEAALDKIPAIIIDPKGDMGNLALAFPGLSEEEFAPWIDPAEAEREGLSTSAYAQKVASTWRDGLAGWGESGERVQNFKNSAEVVIYTPANRAGRPISILSSFAAPSDELRLDTGALRDRVLSLTSSLLGLLGLDADPIKSREHIILSTLITQAWQKGESLSLTQLIEQIQKPPFSKIGALDLDTFFPAKERMSLAISLNNLLASPGFQAWMEGDPLDIQSLLYTPEGKPKLAIMSIAHLSDSERMFFVTLLLNEVLSWMRRQSGTSSLRAILYMDEIFGYFPPTQMPPSKLPMLTLLKQGRAFGLGVILATQNPVDLDYKGLSNCGTWFIGKLQTERDKARILEGLKTSSNGQIEADRLNQLLATAGKRNFILQSIYEKEPFVFQTRWTLSYLRGPLTLVQIEKLTKKEPLSSVETSSETSSVASPVQEKPVVSGDIPEYFVRPLGNQSCSRYKPCLAALAKLHFVDTKNKVDTWQEIALVAEANEEGTKILWEQAESVPDLKSRLEKTARDGLSFDELSAGLMQKKNYVQFQKDLETYLYQTQTYPLFFSPALKIASTAGESERDFKARLALLSREKRDELTAKIREKYAARVEVLSEKLRKAQMTFAEKQQKSGWGKAETAISIGTTLIGALFGKGVTKGTITQAGTSMRRAGKIGQDAQSVAGAEANVQAARDKLEELQIEMQQEMDKAAGGTADRDLEVTSENIRPRKTDIAVEPIALIWWPH